MTKALGVSWSRTIMRVPYQGGTPKETISQTFSLASVRKSQREQLLTRSKIGFADRGLELDSSFGEGTPETVNGG
jgi:hypothetical protein